MSASSPSGWWRKHPDSSGQAKPRVLTAVFVGHEELEATVERWSHLLGVEPDARMPIEELDVVVSTVGNVAIIAAPSKVREEIGETRAVVMVASLDEAHERLLSVGAKVLQGPDTLPMGRRLFAQTPDGVCAEWVEHRPQPGEQPAAAG